MDTPLGETREQYRIRLVGPSGTIEIESDVPQTTISSASLSGIGSGSATLSVQQIGDRAVSRAATAQLILP
jgi:hypothetical protein